MPDDAEASVDEPVALLPVAPVPAGLLLVVVPLPVAPGVALVPLGVVVSTLVLGGVALVLGGVVVVAPGVAGLGVPDCCA